MKLINWLKSILSNIRERFFDIYADKFYSHEGEDMVLNRIFNPAVNACGFYIDIGAHDPKRFSNTYYFYKLGWSGINIDAMPGSMERFKRNRPRDINLEIPISTVSGEELIYYRFNESALNGFSKEISENRHKGNNNYYIVDELKLKTSSLSDVLNRYCPEQTEIDFMSIDVEGLDFDVIKSNDWSKYRPKIILVEILGNTMVNLNSNDIVHYLNAQGYSLYAKTLNTVFFKLSDMVL